jgi:hypothetical protein
MAEVHFPVNEFVIATPVKVEDELGEVEFRHDAAEGALRRAELIRNTPRAGV